MPAIHDVNCGAAIEACFSVRASAGSTPVWFKPSTRTNSPATSGNTDQETSRNTGHGDCRRDRQHEHRDAAPAMKVGKPEIPIHRRSREQHDRRHQDANRRELAAAGQRRNRADRSDGAVKRAALRQPQREIGR